MELISRQAAIDVVAKQYNYESDRMTALQRLPVFDEDSGKTGMSIPVEEVVDMLKAMQIETAKCNGFFAGHVTQAWVISNMLGTKIKDLGGKPYIIKDNKLVNTEE